MLILLPVVQPLNLLFWRGLLSCQNLYTIKYVKFIIMLHVDMIMLINDIDKLHVDISYPACTDGTTE